MRKDSIIDEVRLAQMLRDGRTVTECAKEFGVTSGAVSIRKKRLLHAADQIVPDLADSELCADNIDSMGQLKRINDRMIHAVRRFDDLLTVLDSNIAKQKELEKQLADNPEDAQVKKALDELHKLNINDTSKIYNIFMGIAGEVRKQIELQINIAETLYNIQFTQEFQTEVLEAIKEVAPEVRDKIVKTLKDRRVVRGLIGMKQ